MNKEILTQAIVQTSVDGKKRNTLTTEQILNIKIGEDDLGKLVRSLEARIKKLEENNE